MKEIHQCDKCNQIFDFKSYLKRHIEKSHKKNSSVLEMDESTMKNLVETEQLVIFDTPKEILVKTDSKTEHNSENSKKIQLNQNEIQPNELVKSRSRKQTLVKREFVD